MTALCVFDLEYVPIKQQSNCCTVLTAKHLSFIKIHQIFLLMQLHHMTKCSPAKTVEYPHMLQKHLKDSSTQLMIRLLSIWHKNILEAPKILGFLKKKLIFNLLIVT